MRRLIGVVKRLFDKGDRPIVGKPGNDVLRTLINEVPSQVR